MRQPPLGTGGPLGSALPRRRIGLTQRQSGHRGDVTMINGAHFLLYSHDPEADRAFLRDVLQLKSVDAGGGWLIFALPPAEMGVHPADGNFVQRHAERDLAGLLLFLMCDDIHSTIRSLEAKKVACTKIEEEEWGIMTTFALPSGARIGLYQPKHPTAIGL